MCSNCGWDQEYEIDEIENYLDEIEDFEEQDIDEKRARR